jgi:ferric-dicitrate binding protein FerR (iron transport regulator)
MRFETSFPNEQEIEYGLQKQLQLIDAIADVKETAPKRKLAPRIFAWTATAVFSSFLLFAGWYFWQPGIVTIEVVTTAGEIKRILLPDSSYVTLNESSTLKYTSNIHKAPSRDVWLKGEAFFEVKTITNTRQFIVHTGDLEVTVLGTDFNVKQKNSVMNVTLNKGSLRIGIRNETGSVLTLQPGDFVQYSDKDKHILRKHVNVKLYSAWKEEIIVLDSLPLTSLASLLQDVYGYQLQTSYLSPDTYISGLISFKNEETLMKSIATLLNTKLIKNDTIVLLMPRKTTTVN